MLVGVTSGVPGGAVGVIAGVDVGGAGMTVGGVGIGIDGGVPPTGGVGALVGGFGCVGSCVSTIGLVGGAIQAGFSLRGAFSMFVGVELASSPPDGVGVEVFVGGGLPAEPGRIMMPARISAVLNRMASISTALNGSIHSIAREKPAKGANVRFVFCCCAAAVRNAERPGLSPWGGGGASSKND